MNLSIGICISPQTNHMYFTHQMICVYNLTGLRHKEVVLCGEMNNECYRVAESFGDVMSIKYIPYEGPSDKKGHITKKKNMIADIAFFENLVLMHDYFAMPTTFAEHLPLNKWDVYCSPIHTAEGKRHSDWMVNPEKLQTYINEEVLSARRDDVRSVAERLMAAAPHENAPKYVNALPYSVTYLSPIMYVSGGFICIKTEIMREIKFDENLYWGDAEDVEWSERLVAKYKLSNTAWKGNVPPVKVLKSNKWAVTEMPIDVIKGIKAHYGI
jgi:hypothetical protein